MSNAFALQLPRFEQSSDSVIVGGEPQETELETDIVMDLESPLPEEIALPVEEEEDHWEPDPAPAEVAMEDRLSAFDKLISDLSLTAQQLQNDVSGRVEVLVQGIASALFPKLAEEFLADEISRFLAYALPQNAIEIEIYAPSPLQPALTERLSRLKAVHSSFIISDLPTGAEPSVKVNWGDGGFDYDLTSLLAACHARKFQNGHELEE